MSKKWIVVLGLLSAAFISGFIFGRHNSWNSNDPNTARILLARHAKWQRIAGDRGQLTLRAGLFIYSYTEGDVEVSARYISAAEAAAMPMPKIDLDKDLKELVTLTVAPPAKGILALILGSPVAASELKAFTTRGRIVIGAAMLGTFLAGYALGRKTEPDFVHP